MVRFNLAASLLIALLATATAAAADLTGTWEGRDPVSKQPILLRFNPDGSAVFDEDRVRYSVAGETLKIVLDGETVEYAMKLVGDRLTLSGGDFEEPFEFARKPTSGEKPKDANPPAAAEPAAKAGQPRPAAADSILGTWKADDGASFTFNDDGTAQFPTGKLKFTAANGKLGLRGDGPELQIDYRIDGDRLIISLGGQSQTLRRANAEAADERTPADASGVAGVYVCTESSVDPTIVMTYTQYVILYPDGSVGYAKTEGGASRMQISDSLERFSSFKNAGAENVVGRWEATGGGIVVRWNIWNNLVSEGEAGGDAITLSKMGVLQEGATLRFEKQQ